MRFYVTEQLGPKQALTKEGFLVCQDVPIARTGQYTYGPDETPIPAGPDGVVYIHRDEEEVFRPETIASFNGKPIVNDHPDDDVNPESWRTLAMGTVMNVRRGLGALDDLLLADLFVTDAELIKAIQEGKRELSCGYDADYEELEGKPGHGRQLNIVGNHVALVDSGRCGSRCAIKDRSKVQDCKKEKTMSKILDAIRDAFKKNDGAALETALAKVKDEEPGSVTQTANEPGRTKFTDEALTNLFKSYDDKHKMHDDRHKIHDDRLAGHDDKLKAHDTDLGNIKSKLDGMEPGGGTDANIGSEKEIEGHLENEAPPGTGDKARKAKDSVYLEESHTATIALAEVIVPGIRIPAFARDAKPLETYRNICGLRRKALQLATKDSASVMMLEEIRNGRPLEEDELKEMQCGQVRDLFFALGAMKKNANRADLRVTTNNNGGITTTRTTGVHSLAELNKRHATEYKQ
jgi:hypothetical protein